MVYRDIDNCLPAFCLRLEVNTNPSLPRSSRFLEKHCKYNLKRKVIFIVIDFIQQVLYHKQNKNHQLTALNASTLEEPELV